MRQEDGDEDLGFDQGEIEDGVSEPVVDEYDR